MKMLSNFLVCIYKIWSFADVFSIDIKNIYIKPCARVTIFHG